MCVELKQNSDIVKENVISFDFLAHLEMLLWLVPLIAPLRPEALNESQSLLISI